MIRTKILLLLIFILFLIGIRMSLKTKNSNLETIQISTTSQQMIQKKSIVKNSSIFIPYWALPQSKEDIDAYDRLMYFGIGVSPNRCVMALNSS